MDNEVTITDIKDICVTKEEELAEKILNENDEKELKNLTYLFNLNQAKKNVTRVLKLNKLLDNVWEEASRRVEKTPDEFSNLDLLNYTSAIQSALDKANKSLELVNEAPMLQLNQVNVQVNGKVLDRESRDKIESAVEAITKKLNLKIEECNKEDTPLTLLKEEEDE